ncbi:unnamed protein product [Rotaria magnacalcarata]|uniref:G-patch domain-containing protein n=1 Tax=Rotaria magnacalcarata TaxID=392030 RepID=A0A816RZS9_9BILA|nr:unnamed protein product [Rotaria magnacalcarata]
MVSLNEKRSKVQYVVQNKTEWVDDDNKFGKRMLEKMGWKSGVGLGKNENGRTEHIDLKFKSNLKGVGFINGKYDSTWIAHSQSFDSLLQQLQQAHSPSASSSSSTIHNFHQTVQQTKTRFTMLEKMGWKSGVGLGKNENGRTEHIDLKFKSNLKGVGFINGKYDSTWIAHSQSFDSLLQQLQQAHSPSASSSSSTIHNFHQTVQQTKTRFTMLEKMGWKSGVGLGKNENGRTEHIDLKFKSNLKGVGFINGKYDSTWIAHSQSFDSLLQQLQQAHSPSASSSSSTIHNFHQTVQQTKTRFTYKKQSSGKDLSSRSNDELDCIFGWNKGNQLKIDQIKQDSSLDMTNEIISDNLYKTSEQSIEDYFKEKTKKKAQIQYEQSQSLNDQTIDSVDQNSSNEEINERVESKLEKNLKKRRNYSTESIVDCDQSEMLPKKKKKSDQLNNDIEDPYKNCNLSELNGYQGWIIDSSLENIIKKKLKQNKRRK